MLKFQIILIYFSQTGKHLASKIQNNSNKYHSYYLTGNSDIHFQFQEINEESILKIIYNFPAKYNSGYDGITLKQLK